MFFVISGYVITGWIWRQLRLNRMSFPTFLGRRVRRLVPALALLSIVVLVLSAIFVSPIDAQRDTATLGAGGATWTANLLMIPLYGGYWDPQTSASPLMHLWTLSVEDQFYLAFPWVLMAGFALRKWWGAAAVLAIVGVASFGLVLALGSGWDPSPTSLALPAEIAFFSPFTRAWEFVAGAVLFLAALRMTIPAAARFAAGWLGLAAIAFAVLTPAREAGPGSWMTLLAVFGAVAVIASGSDSAHATGSAGRLTAGRLLSTPAMVFLGAVSYSWYLWHWPTWVFATSLTPWHSAQLLAIPISLGLAYLAYRYVENPIHEGVRLPEWSAPRILLVGSGLTIATALLLAFCARNEWWNDGVRDFAAQTQPLDAAAERGCFTVSLQAAAVDCTWNPDASGKPVYLVGDSNASMYSNGVIAAAQALGRPVTVFTRPGCSIFDAVPTTSVVGRDAGQQQACQQYERSLLDRLASAPAGDIVTASAFRSRQSAWRASRKARAAGPTFEEQTSRLIAQSLAPLTAAGQHVTLLSSLPRLNSPDGTQWSPAACPGFKVLSNAPSCGVEMSINDATGFQRAMWALEPAAAKGGGANYADLRPQICEGGVCTTNRGDFWVYRDGLHLSRDYSASLAPTFEAILGGTAAKSG